MMSPELPQTTPLHPKGHEFYGTLRALLPEAIAGFLGGLCAASSAIYSEGGLAVVRVSNDPLIEWQPSSPSSRKELLEFFACVCGDPSLERTFEAAPALEGFEASLRCAYPNCTLHLQVEPDTPSCPCTLHVIVTDAAGERTYIHLFWSID
jgi:hypothetical protein